MYHFLRPLARNSSPSGKSRVVTINSVFNPSSETLRNNKSWPVRLKNLVRVVPTREPVPLTKLLVLTMPTLTKLRARPVLSSTLRRMERSSLATIQTLSVSSLSSTIRARLNCAISITSSLVNTQTTPRQDASSLFARMARKRTSVLASA